MLSCWHWQKVHIFWYFTYHPRAFPSNLLHLPTRQLGSSPFFIYSKYQVSCMQERERERMVMVVEEVASSKLIAMPILKKKQQNRINNSSSCKLSARKRELVCVTSGNSYLGSHIVKELLAYGYPVRVTIQNQGT